MPNRKAIERRQAEEDWDSLIDHLYGTDRNELADKYDQHDANAVYYVRNHPRVSSAINKVLKRKDEPIMPDFERDIRHTLKYYSFGRLDDEIDALLAKKLPGINTERAALMQIIAEEFNIDIRIAEKYYYKWLND